MKIWYIFAYVNGFPIDNFITLFTEVEALELFTIWVKEKSAEVVEITNLVIRMEEDLTKYGN